MQDYLRDDSGTHWNIPGSASVFAALVLSPLCTFGCHGMAGKHVHTLPTLQVTVLVDGTSAESFCCHSYSTDYTPSKCWW